MAAHETLARKASMAPGAGPGDWRDQKTS